MSARKIPFGLPDEWDAFAKDRAILIAKLQLLFETLTKMFVRQVQTRNSADRVIFCLGRICTEDFMEILLLCGNGYGIGGMELLRGLYERAVTIGYIAKHPQKADQFLEYYYVHVGKQFNHAKRVLPMDKYLSKAQIEQIVGAYENTKEKYKEVVCKKCGTRRTRLSWSELDLLSMAREVGFDGLYRECYYEPTLQTHSTVASLAARMTIKEDGQLLFDEGAQRTHADLALIGAHNVLIRVLDLENDHFKMGLEREIQECEKDFMLVWGAKNTTAAE
jgi:hypothetical protein